MFSLRGASSSLASAARSFSSLLTGTAVRRVQPSTATLSSTSSSSPLLSHLPSRASSTATGFRFKKQKEWKTREARGFKAMKTHPGCKKRFRFTGRFAVVCKHSGKYHKNYHKRANRLARLRPMKIVPRHLVKRLKVMMPYWRNQLQKERNYRKIHAEKSVSTPSQISYERQKQFIEAQNKRLMDQLLQPKPYFPAAL